LCSTASISWDVLDEEDALLTEKLEDMVESGELQPYAGATLLDGTAASSATAVPGSPAVIDDRVFGPGGEALVSRFAAARPAVR
jgi:hypothetical protein